MVVEIILCSSWLPWQQDALYVRRIEFDVVPWHYITTEKKYFAADLW
jgi:hypothetical protein